MKITRQTFIEAVGREPENDDLERCNCAKAVEVGHFSCGWDADRNLPRFMTGTMASAAPPARESSAMPFKENDRVRLINDAEIFPVGIFPAGLVGTVVDVDLTSNVIFYVRLDEHFDSLNEWNNGLQIGESGSDEVFVTVDDLELITP